MSDTIAGVLAIVLLFVGLPLVILKVRDRVVRTQRDHRNRPETQAAARQAYEQRIVRPDWEYVERHLGMGDVYLRSGPSEADGVHITYHDGGDTEIFADSVAEMLDVLRQRNRA
jgi:hypothetical protein